MVATATTMGRRIAFVVLVVSLAEVFGEPEWKKPYDPSKDPKQETWCDKWRERGPTAPAVVKDMLKGNLAQMNDLAAPEEAIQGVVTYKHADERGATWFGSMFGVPMALTRLEERRAQPLAVWIRKQLPRWRKLPVNFEWPEATRGSVTSKYRSYNALHEASQSKVREVRESADYVLKTMKETFVDVAEYYDQLPKLKRGECPGGFDWEERIMKVDEHILGPQPAGVRLQSYVTALHAASPGYDYIPVHQHDYAWHGYILFDADLTNTTYHGPPPAEGLPRPLFNVVNEDFVLVIVNGGIDHGIPPPPADIFGKPQRPRLSVAFDFAFSLEVKGKVVGHPGARFKNQPLKIQELDNSGHYKGKHRNKQINTWSVFMTTKETHKMFKSFSPNTFDHTAFATEENHPSLWAGTVDMHILLPDLSHEGNRRARRRQQKKEL